MIPLLEAAAAVVVVVVVATHEEEEAEEVVEANERPSRRAARTRLGEATVVARYVAVASSSRHIYILI
jgi:hypothetical protein